MPNTANTGAKYTDNIWSLLQSGMARQLAFLIGVAISVALGIVIYMMIQEPLYQPLDYQVTQQNMSSIVDTLDKAGIQYKINDQAGVVMVAANDVQRAKLKLAAAGVPKDDSFNYSFLNDQNNLANSQFLENARYLRALENDLGKTIVAIEGVSAARVHIAIPQNNVFADDNNKATASVMLTIAPTFMSDHEKIRSIMQIVADSVPGLDPKDVAVTDQYGHYLSGGINQDSIFNAEQLNYQNNLQGYYEKRIQTMIEPILGANKVNVRVYADVDFTQQEQAEEIYDPDKRAIISEQSSTEQSESGGASGAPGSLSNSPPSDDNDKGQSGGGGSGGQSRSQSTKNYDVSKSVNYKRMNVAKIKSLSAAVVVDNQMVMDPKTKQYVAKPLDQDTINKITQLVKTTIGFDDSRGDKVTVINSSFSEAKQDIVMPEVKIWNQAWFWDMVKRFGGLIAGFILLIVICKRLAGFMKAGSTIRVAPRTSVVEPMYNEAEDAEKKKTQQERMAKLKQLANADPSRVALIIKNWVGK